jgi:hypothetical protein
MASTKTPSLGTTDNGIIIPDRLYSFQAFERLTGIGRAGLREARNKGLEVKYFGRQGHILGQTIITFILDNGKASR